jgi:hypothetical protein
MFLGVELCLTAFCVGLAYICPGLANSWFSHLERRFVVFAEKRVLAVISVGVLALSVRLALLPILPVPQPGIHDEYSHLLLADTLAHGRLSNPTHPMWVHFETFHVNWKPAYASMYFPGQAVFLALGQVSFGHPFWGMWLSVGLMCAAICWALQGWLGPSGALLGGLLAVIRLGTFSYWANGYWGGAVPALGGALVLGSLPRIKGDQRIRNSLLLGLGTALLLSTRPYESLFFLLPTAVALVVWIFRAKHVSSRSSFVLNVLTRVIIPAGLVVLLSTGALAYYFWRVTGSPWTTPYKINMVTYGLVYFPWDKIVPITYRFPALQDFYRGGAVLGMYRFAREHPIELLLAKASTIWLFYFGPVLTLPLIAAIATPDNSSHTSRETKFLLVTCATTFLALALIVYVGHPHYLAPLTTAFYALVLIAMRSLRGWKWGTRASGMFLVRTVPVICLMMFLARIAAPLAHASTRYSGIRTWCSEDRENLARARIMKQLQHLPGNHLVIVRYAADHDFILDEWVFNNAEIDGSKVIWARDMGARNVELLQYFNQRRVWLLEPDYNPPRLSRYAQ